VHIIINYHRFEWIEVIQAMKKGQALTIPTLVDNALLTAAVNRRTINVLDNL